MAGAGVSGPAHVLRAAILQKKVVLTLVKTVGETLFRTVVRGTKTLTVGRGIRVYSE